MSVTLEQLQFFGDELRQIFPGETIAVTNVSQTQFSIARHYGGIKFNGKRFTYFPGDDLLVRDDVVKLLKKYAKKLKGNP